MSSDPGTPVAEAPPDRGQQLPETYARKATGLVREVPLMDMLAFNASAATPLGLGLVIGMVSVFAVFPGANIMVDFAVALVILPFLWVTYALMAAAMPRVGGDYLYGSRVFHPIVGLFSNLGTYTGAVLSAGFAAYAFGQFGVVPIVGIIGTVTGSQAWLDAGTTLSSKGWTFGLGAGLIVVMSLLSIVGTKKVARVVAWAYFIALGSVVVSVLVLLFTSRSGFVNSINEFALPFTDSTDTYADTVEAGAKAGLVYPSEQGYSLHNTIGALFPVLAFFNATYYGVFLVGEMKGGGRRGRQLTALVGAGYFQLVLAMIAVTVFLNTTGYEFFVAANNGAFPLDVSPYFNFFASVLIGSDVLAVLLGFAFLLAVPAWLYGNLGVSQRIPFAWAFDGLLPRQIAAVDARTHTPVLAIVITMILGVGCVAFATFLSDSFVQVLTYTVLLGFVSFPIVGAAAIVLPWRRPEIYKGSGAEWRIGRVHVLPIAGAGSMALGALVYYIVFRYHENLGVEHVEIPILVLAGLAVAAVSLYLGARAVQRRRGVDLDLVYRTIPAE